MKDHTNTGSNLPQDRVATYLRKEDQQTIFAIIVVLSILAFGFTTCYVIRCGGLVRIDQLQENSYTFQVDLNSADWTEISALPNIGEKIAHRIVRFRNRFGPFKTLQSLTLVDGIGIHTIQSIRPYVGGLPWSEDRIADKK